MRVPWAFAAACVLVTGFGAATNAALRRPAAPRPAVPSSHSCTGADQHELAQRRPSAAARGAARPGRAAQFTCYNCTSTVPSPVEFDHSYRDCGLTLIGIHTPEFPPYSGEHDKDNLARALAKYDISYPNAQDNDRRTWDAYEIRFWPSFVLIDKRGLVRYPGYGEFHRDDADFRTWDGRIRELLAE